MHNEPSSSQKKSHPRWYLITSVPWNLNLYSVVNSSMKTLVWDHQHINLICSTNYKPLCLFQLFMCQNQCFANMLPTFILMYNGSDGSSMIKKITPSVVTMGMSFILWLSKQQLAWQLWLRHEHHLLKGLLLAALPTPFRWNVNHINLWYLTWLTVTSLFDVGFTLSVFRSLWNRFALGHMSQNLITCIGWIIVITAFFDHQLAIMHLWDESEVLVVLRLIVKFDSGMSMDWFECHLAIFEVVLVVGVPSIVH